MASIRYCANRMLNVRVRCDLFEEFEEFAVNFIGLRSFWFQTISYGDSLRFIFDLRIIY